ncbi:MAG: hypothetical protein JWP06_614 [Candidatus Saccharibacteria bacterium]|nr:hypothetical protein [Candidatus Saccharibacteria bacterium]
MNQSVYVFDVDGVLNNMDSHMPDGRTIAHMVTLLEQGMVIAINTGRSYEWIEENIIQDIRRTLQSPDPLNNLFIATEMGGIGIEFVNGVERKVHSAFSMLPDQIAKAREIFERHPDFVKRMRWYDGKESMATVSKGLDIDMDTFKADQRELTAILQDAFAGQHVQVANSTDAVDIHAPEAGKWAGAQLVYDWLNRTSNIKHDHFVCFGDSIVDYEMARYFAQQDENTIFVFTGPAFNGATEDSNIKFIKTEQPYNKGTYQYLEASSRIS